MCRQGLERQPQACARVVLYFNITLTLTRRSLVSPVSDGHPAYCAS